MPEDDERGFYIASSGSRPLSYFYGPSSQYPTGEASELSQGLIVSKTGLEQKLRSLMEAFERSATQEYAVKKAKTWITTTRNANGQVEVGLGFGPVKIFGADGKLQSETVQGIEIEIERREAAKETHSRSE